MTHDPQFRRRVPSGVVVATEKKEPTRKPRCTASAHHHVSVFASFRARLAIIVNTKPTLRFPHTRNENGGFFVVVVVLAGTTRKLHDSQ